jgi:hypothetical protein
MFEKLTDIAKHFCITNGFNTDEQLNNLKKELKIILRLEHGIKPIIYNKMKLSELIEFYINNREEITGQIN